MRPAGRTKQKEPEIRALLQASIEIGCSVVLLDSIQTNLAFVHSVLFHHVLNHVSHLLSALKNPFQRSSGKSAVPQLKSILDLSASKEQDFVVKLALFQHASLQRKTNCPLTPAFFFFQHPLSSTHDCPFNGLKINIKPTDSAMQLRDK
jgi:hypothetical protein